MFNKILDWFVQIGSALKYLNEKLILHRDIKLDVNFDMLFVKFNIIE